MARRRVADLLVDTLVAAGVERIYGLAGASPSNPLPVCRCDAAFEKVGGTPRLSVSLSLADTDTTPVIY
jgi:hypothetical protein